MLVKKYHGPVVEVAQEDLSHTEELLGGSAEDFIYIEEELDDIEEVIYDMEAYLGDSEDDFHNIEEQPDDIEEHLGDTEDDVEDVDSNAEAYPNNAERQRTQDTESISSLMESLDGRINKLEASIPTLASIKAGSNGVSVEYANCLLDRIQDLEAQLATEEEGRAQAEELSRALLLSTSRSSRSPSLEPQTALPPIHSLSSRGSRSTRAARPPTRTLFHRSPDSRISKRGPTRRRYSITYISTRRLTFAEQMSRGAWRQRWWGLGGAAVVAAGAALWTLAVNTEVKNMGQVFVSFVRLIEGL